MNEAVLSTKVENSVTNTLRNITYWVPDELRKKRQTFVGKEIFC